MRVLITTPPRKGIIPFYTCRKEFNVEIEDIHDKDDLLQLGINSEYQLGTEWPNGGLHFIKANVPSVDILDYPSIEEYETRLNEGSYDVVAFSFRRKDVPQILNMVKMARDHGVETVWAGNYGANSPGLDGVFDRIFIGEGVQPLKSLIEGRPLDYLRHPMLLGKIWDRFPLGYIYTAIGCRYRCKFCSTRNFIPKPLYVPIEEIRRVLDTYVHHGVKTVTILDETFLQDSKRSERVIQELSKRRLTWHCTTRINLLRGRVKQLYEKGMRSIYTGIESLTNHTLSSYKKGQTTRAILDVFNELNDFDIRTAISYIMGYEFDTAESILESIEIIKNEIKPFCSVYLVLTPHTNAGLTHLEPLVVDHDSTHYNTRHLVWKHPHLSPEDIRELLWIAQKETLHPRNNINRRIIDKVKQIESKESPLYSERIQDIYRTRQQMRPA